MPQESPSSARLSAARIGQIVLGLIWSIDGLLKLQPFFFHDFAQQVIDPNAAGQPKLLGDPITFIGNHIVGPHQEIFSLFVVLVEVSIGSCLILGRFVKPALLVSFGWALGVWYTGEGLGGIFTNATPSPLVGILGTTPLYIVAGLLAWPRDTGLGLLGHRGARAAWATLWIGSAVLWLFPSNDGANAFQSAFAGAPNGVGFLTSVQSSAAKAVTGDGMTIALILAGIFAAIAVSVVFNRGTRIALVASMAISLTFAVLAEGFGGIFTGQATDIGTNPLMILIAAQLLVLAPRSAVAVSRSRVRAVSPA